MKQISILLLALVFLSGCLKDRITHLVEGTYIVSGTKVVSGANWDSLGVMHFYTNSSNQGNINVNINKVDTSTIEATIDFPDGGVGYCFYQPNESSKYIFFFRGEIAIDRYATFTFNAKKLKHIDLVLGIPSGNVNSTTYYLSGTKN